VHRDRRPRDRHLAANTGPRMCHGRASAVREARPARARHYGEFLGLEARVTRRR
jgi:hypothetical protein